MQDTQQAHIPQHQIQQEQTTASQIDAKGEDFCQIQFHWHSQNNYDWIFDKASPKLDK